MILRVEELTERIDYKEKGARGGFTRVVAVEVDPPGCRGNVHINNTECWPKGSLMEVRA